MAIKKQYAFYYIYMIKNLINKKCYVGFHATNGECEDDTYYGSGTLLKHAIKKYGVNNFTMGIIEYVKPEEWQEKERFWIKEMKSHITEHGYNMTRGGDGTLGYVWNDEQRKTVGKVNLGRKRSDKTKENISASHIGFKQPKETIEKRTLKITGKHRTPESKKLYSLSKVGDKNPMYQKSYTEEEKEACRKRALNQIKKICEYCGKELFARHYAQYHGENCKFNPKNKLVRESLMEKPKKS